jgi:hypothetical protein
MRTQYANWLGKEESAPELYEICAGPNCQNQHLKTDERASSLPSSIINIIAEATFPRMETQPSSMIIVLPERPYSIFLFY